MIGFMGMGMGMGLRLLMFFGVFSVFLLSAGQAVPAYSTEFPQGQDVAGGGVSDEVPVAEEEVELIPSATEAWPGQEIQVTGKCLLWGYPATRIFTSFFYDSPVDPNGEHGLYTSLYPEADGSVDTVLKVPDNAVPGKYDLVFTCFLDDVAFGLAEYEFTVLGDVPVSPPTTPVPTDPTPTPTQVPVVPTPTPTQVPGGEQEGLDEIPLESSGAANAVDVRGVEEWQDSSATGAGETGDGEGGQFENPAGEYTTTQFGETLGSGNVSVGESGSIVGDAPIDGVSQTAVPGENTSGESPAVAGSVELAQTGFEGNSMLAWLGVFLIVTGMGLGFGFQRRSPGNRTK